MLINIAKNHWNGCKYTLFYKEVSNASKSRLSQKCKSILVSKLDFLKFTVCCYFVGEEGNSIQDWKYEHYHVCAIALEWFYHSQSQSYHEWACHAGEKCLNQLKNLFKLS